jgi:hypothetical protein
MTLLLLQMSLVGMVLIWMDSGATVSIYHISAGADISVQPISINYRALFYHYRAGADIFVQPISINELSS